MLQKLLGAEGDLEAVGQAVGETLGLRTPSLAVTVPFDYLVEPYSLLLTESLHCFGDLVEPCFSHQAVQLMRLCRAPALHGTLGPVGRTSEQATYDVYGMLTQHENVYTVIIGLAEGSVVTCNHAQASLFATTSVLEVQASQTWRC